MCFLRCGIPNRGIQSVKYPIPRSNVQVAEEVITRALKNLGLPEGQGRKAACIVEGDNKACELLRIIAPEILLKQRYHIVKEKSSIPVFRFTVDTLRVIHTSERSHHMGKRINRFAEAFVTVALIETKDTRQVYRGRGTYYDSFESQMLNSIKSNDSFVIDRISSDWYPEKIKPVIIGIVMTLLAWTLYSYRG